MSGVSALLALAKQQRPTWTADKQHIQIGALTLPRKTLTPYKCVFPLSQLAAAQEFEQGRENRRGKHSG
jgi:hypothetical protein